MSNGKRKWVPVFLGLELCCYLIFLYLDVAGGGEKASTALKFIGISLCLGWVLLSAGRGNLLIPGAFAFTVFADVCLLLADYYQTGVLSFLVVQVFYLFWLRKKHGAGPVLKIIVGRFIVSLGILGLFLLLKVPVDSLLVISTFYFVNILHNTCLAIGWHRKEKKRGLAFESGLFAYGMVLFLLCDIQVGIFNMTKYLELGHPAVQGFVSFGAVAMWLFYLPGQVFLALAGTKGE